jgi:nucleoside-diphosphate-sugar epimerase
VRMVMEVSGIKGDAILNPRSDPGVSRMRADISLAREKLGYQPRITLEQGLRMTLERDPRFQRGPRTGSAG